MSLQALEGRLKGLQGSSARCKLQIDELQNDQNQVSRRNIGFRRDELEKNRKSHIKFVNSIFGLLEISGEVGERLQKSSDRFMDTCDQMREILNQFQDRIDQSSASSSRSPPNHQTLSSVQAPTDQLLKV
jgi:hypothetical protein